ncbi:FecR family protein [Sphingopyxis terrae]|uniref:FecR family protein n=1 Tax=Sphingopyxis terrae TaxID=33052 RepID=UPI000A4A2FCE|nr:FecR family protein [Sphingopyxis terrae]
MSGRSEERTPGEISRRATAWMLQLDDEPDDEALRAEFENWLTSHPAHLAAWEETEHVSDLISAAGPLSQNRPPPGSAHPISFSKFMSARAFVSLAVAACLAWIVVPSIALQLRADEVSRAGEPRIVSLDDGSTVHLAPATAIAFTTGAKGRYLELLQGEAWFDVAHDEARPFRVMAGDSIVTVLGTAFSVRKTDTGTDVAVQRGRVAVATNDAAPPARVELVAGQSLSLSKGASTLAEIRPENVASWREGVAIVSDQSIGEVIERLRPWYKGFIVARGPGLMRRRVSGIYDLRDPDLALEAIARAHRVKVSRVSPWLRIVTVG